MGARDPWLIKTESLILADRRGRKKMEKYLQDGWEVVATTKTAFTRATQVTFRKPNPKYSGPPPVA